MALPLVILHTKNNTVDNMRQTVARIREQLPDIYIKVITIGSKEFPNLRNILDQSKTVSQEITKDPQLAGGFNMLCHGRTGLMGRYYVEHYNKPAVHNYISWGTPQMGTFGKPSDIDFRLAWLNVFRVMGYHIFYSYFFQKFVPLAGFWRDPLHYKEYLERCLFLPALNNEIDHIDAEKHKKNLASLNALVLVNSHNEHHVGPMESCHFGYYKIGSMTEKEKLFDMPLFNNDLLGLRTLHDQNKLYMLWADCEHELYSADEENFLRNTLPFLKDGLKKPQPASNVVTREEIL